jgi:hypothetical protein
VRLEQEEIREGPKRRALRALCPPEVTDCTLVVLSLGGQPLQVTNISELGLRAVANAGQNRPKSGDILAGTLRLGGSFLFSTRLRVVHVSEKGEIGAEFLQAPRRLRDLVRSYFRHELLGATMKRAPSDKSVIRFQTDSTCWLEISTDRSGVKELRAAIPELSAGVTSWTRGSSKLPVAAREQLLRLAENLPGLEPDQRASLRAGLSRRSSN